MEIESLNRFCKYCGCSVESDMLFCPSCGKSLDKETNRPIVKQPRKKMIIVVGTIGFVLVLLLIYMNINARNNVFQRAFETAGGANFCGEWVTVFDDGSGIKIDTNPRDIEDYYDASAMEAVEKIHAALGLPDSLIEKMTNTSALNGRQSQTYGNIEVSWTYHPNHGLEIIYERI